MSTIEKNLDNADDNSVNPTSKEAPKLQSTITIEEPDSEPVEVNEDEEDESLPFHVADEAGKEAPEKGAENALLTIRTTDVSSSAFFFSFRKCIHILYSESGD